jgi:hypothetical protein
MNSKNERPNPSDTPKNIKYAIDLCKPKNFDEDTLIPEVFRAYQFLKKCLEGVTFLAGLEYTGFQIPKDFYEYILQSSEKENDLEVQQIQEHTCNTGRYNLIPVTLETFEVLILRYGRDGDGLNINHQSSMHKGSYEYVLVVQLRCIYNNVRWYWRDENETEMTVDEPDNTSLILDQINGCPWTILGAWKDNWPDSDTDESRECLKQMRQLRTTGYNPILIRVNTLQDEEYKKYLYLFLPNEEIEGTNSDNSLPENKAAISYDGNKLTVYGERPEDSYEPLIQLESNSLDQKEFVKAIETHVLNTSGSKTRATQIEELTKVPLHCSHTLPYPYTGKYNFIKH